MNDTILKAVLNKVSVWEQMYANHDPTVDEINDRNWLGMCKVLRDRIEELEVHADALVGEKLLAESVITELEVTLAKIKPLPEKWKMEYHNIYMGDDDFKHGRKVALHQAANAVDAILIGSRK